jgi:hypothetical protein
MTRNAVTLLRWYLWLLGVGLLAQGLVAFAFSAAHAQPPSWTSTALTTHPRHSIVHVIWGLAIVALLARGLRDQYVVWLGLGFAIFYLSFALLFLVVHQPFGMTIDPSQNAFHFIVGPLALLLSVLALRSRQLRTVEGSAGIS